jgi:hypothetical protein
MECKSDDRALGDSLLCLICHETVSIPVGVQPSVFNCECMNHHAICLVCTRDYFQLNKPLQSRQRVKCLICPKKSTDVARAAKGTYFHNGLVSKLMESKGIPTVCRRCETEFDTAAEARRHLSACPESSVPCYKCPAIVRRKDLDTHEDDECPYRIVVCKACGVTCPFFMIEDHCVDSCNKILYPCWKCGDYFDRFSLESHHESGCRGEGSYDPR